MRRKTGRSSAPVRVIVEEALLLALLVFIAVAGLAFWVFLVVGALKAWGLM